MHKMYGLSPCPISRHHVSILLFFAIKFLISYIINVALKVQTCKHAPNYLARVPIPDIILHGLPLRRASHCWEGTFISKVCILPLNTAKVNRINLSMKVQVVGNGGRVIMGDQCHSP